ncbi:hypothetical protein SLW70_03840 [Flavobacterium sp. NG2]|uniref:hypothetical protein n=1 Tax=Flavobacterium sp. NG2 TaxID=3097547 RepID=UPI002A8184A6|nr:hypothetical protein [Flavobacterium sp. NG2]WPR72282.1 hypothetical protein SLW70_03840 [Flavobacterium sp. NG2]
MKEKKNIDRLFQEQLKDFEATPNSQVWQNIQAELNQEKKKRRLLPFWLKYAGIAAALVLGVFMLKTGFQKDLTPTNTPIVKGQDSNQNRSIDKDPSIKKEAKIIQEEALVTNENIPSKNEANQINTNTKRNKYNSTQNKSPKENTANEKNDVVAQQRTLLAENNSKTTKDLLETVVKNNTESKVVDATNANADKKEAATKTVEEKNELEEILKTKTEKKTELASISKNKWQITPNIAPIYLNTNSGGSAIDNQFSDNEKTAEKSLSYGLGINYAINSKIAIRTGINKVVLGYNTTDITYSPGLATNSITTINYLPSNAVEIKNEASFNTLNSTEKSIQNTTTGSINQTMGYYEFPLEISYSLLDKKFGISLIGGFSTLFLDENKISLVSSQSNVELGEANNLNKIHLSSNFGVGFKYQLFPSIQFHFEPTIKYQMNTFSSQSNNFKPVFLGLYSGVSYRF